MEIRINGVNVFNPLEGKLDDIIECFVEFYGEKHREKITHNLKNTDYFFLPKNFFKKFATPSLYSGSVFSILPTMCFKQTEGLEVGLTTINGFCLMTAAWTIGSSNTHPRYSTL